MYTRLLHAQLKDRNSLDRCVNFVKGQLLPSLQHESGLADMFILANHEHGKISLVSFWHSEEDARKFDLRLADFRALVAELSSFFIDPLSDEAYELFV